MFKKYTYTREETEVAVAASYSLAETARGLGIPYRSNYTMVLKGKIEEWGLDTSHFLGQHWRSRPDAYTVRPIEDLLVEDCPRPGGSFKRRLLTQGLLEDKCARCGISEWGGLRVCDLDHINANHRDNRLENLQMLCPNCHRVKTIKERRAQRKPKVVSVKRPKAEPKKREYVPIPRENWKTRLHKVQWPSPEVLSRLVWEKPMSQLAEDFGVSDVTVAKWIKVYGLARPPRGYWQSNKK